jgi:3-oxoacyl-[acyl-carrier protein] reductase
MNSYDLSGRKAVITGGAQGIGLAVARRMAASGATVEIWDIDAAEARRAAAEIGPAGRFRIVDVTSLPDVEAAAAAAEAAMGKVDILVTSAGIAGPNAPSWTYPVEDWHRIMRLNLDGTYFCTRAFAPGMIARNYGRMVLIASVAGKEGNPNAAPYSASKAAVIALAKALGKELAKHDIAVNAITPAAARTRIFDQMKPEFIEFMLSKIPRARFVEVEEIATMVTFMASQENSFTTGAVFDITGGRATY